MDTLVINYKVYENGIEYLGTTEVTLPDVEFLSETISGGDIAGEVEEIITGHLSAMTTTFNFRTVSHAANKLMEPRLHVLDLRVAQQSNDLKSGKTGISNIKHVLKVKPKKTGLGKVAAASTADVSGEYATSYYAQYIGGKKTVELDPMNYVCYINGTDYLEDVRKALGK